MMASVVYIEVVVGSKLQDFVVLLIVVIMELQKIVFITLAFDWLYLNNSLWTVLCRKINDFTEDAKPQIRYGLLFSQKEMY